MMFTGDLTGVGTAMRHKYRELTAGRGSPILT